MGPDAATRQCADATDTVRMHQSGAHSTRSLDATLFKPRQSMLKGNSHKVLKTAVIRASAQGIEPQVVGVTPAISNTVA